MHNFNYKTITLDNNLRVILLQTQKSSKFEINITVNTGSNNEIISNNGISHFLEHMMFRGSKKYPNSVKLATKMEELGGDCNAETTNETTSYWLNGSIKYFDKGIKIFKDFFLYPNFIDIILEKKIILEELASDYNEAGRLIDVSSLAMYGLFTKHSLSLPVIGTKNTLKQITIQDIKAYRNKYYSPLNSILCVISSLDKDYMETIVQQYFNYKWKYKFIKYKMPDYSYLTNPLTSKKRLWHIAPAKVGYKLKNNSPLYTQKAIDIFIPQNNTDNQYVIQLSLATIGANNKNVIIASFLEKFLGDGIASRFLSQLREKQGLAYEISTTISIMSDISTFDISATVSKDRLEKFLVALAKEICLIWQKPPSLIEMQRVKTRYLFALESLRENVHNYSSYLVWQLFNNPSFSLEEEKDIVSDLTVEELLNFTQNLFNSLRRVFVLIGPNAKLFTKEIKSFFKTLNNNLTY